jgi:hypothetical protein
MSISSTMFVMPVLLYAKWNPSDSRLLQCMHEQQLQCTESEQKGNNKYLVRAERTSHKRF